MKTCSVDQCDNTMRTRGYCNKHYKKWRKYGDPLYEYTFPKYLPCMAEGCDRNQHARGWRHKHWSRWKKHGDPNYIRPSTPARNCEVEGCLKPHYLREWCTMHYQAWLKHGDPLKGGRAYSDPEDSFAARTQLMPSGCIEWTGATDSDGYGNIWVEGGHRSAHIYSWEKANGPVPEGSELDHRCRNKPCVNHNHLRVVTRKENSQHRSPESKHSSSGYRNVFWNKKYKNWVVQVRSDGKLHYGGSHKDLDDAVEAARRLRSKLYTHNDLDRRQAA